MGDQARAEAIFALVQAFADVMDEDDPEQQKALAVSWCAQCDDFYEKWPSESMASVATYIGLTLMDDDGMGTLPGRVPEEMHDRICADIFSVRALADSDEA